MSPYIALLFTVSHEQILAAQRASLREAGHPAADVQIELKGISPELLVPGTLRFDWSGLAKPSFASASTTLFWRGNLLLASGEQKGVWTRVRLTTRRKGFIAARPISAGRTIVAEDLKLAELTESIFEQPPVLSAEQVVGKRLARSLPGGKPLVTALLADSESIRRGDTVFIEASQGSASLRFEAVAENSARRGERVYFKNPLNGRRIRGLAVSERLVRVKWEDQR